MKHDVIEPSATNNISSPGAGTVVPAAMPGVGSALNAALKFFESRQILSGVALLTLTAIGFRLAIFLFDWALPSTDDWAIYWPYDGIALALLLITDRRRWRWILGGFVIAFSHTEIIAQHPPSEAFIDISCNVAEILFSAYFLPPFRSLRRWMMEPHLALRFTVFAVLVGPALTSLPAAWYFSGSQGTFWSIALKWAFPDALGTALWTPLIFTLISRETYDLFRLKALPQTLPLLTGLVAISWFTFRQSGYPLSFVAYPMLLFVALRLGFSGAVLGANMLSLIAAYLSLRGYGPFHRAFILWSDQQTIILQVYSTLAMLFVLPLSVILVERRNFAEKLQRALEEMKDLATIDQLTAVANRRRFDETLDTEWKRAIRDATPISLLMIDADHFKTFNDRYGHVAGDDCLRGIAAALSAKPLRQHDLVARYGGEEFAAILPGAPAAAAEELAEQMRLSVLESCVTHEGNPTGCVTVSIGCASLVPAKGMSPAELIASADRALYLAKESGRNRVCTAAPRLVEPMQRPA
jgi:diguanylate cyclase (GGDEF)-like protein